MSICTILGIFISTHGFHKNKLSACRLS